MNKHSSSWRAAARRLAWAAVAGAPFALLTACGGGGGGGDTAAAPATTTTAVVITSVNAKPVSADALTNSTDSSTAQAGSSLVTGVQVNGDGAGNGTLQFASAVRALVAMVPPPLQLATGVQGSQTMQCSQGGSLTVSYNTASSTAVTAGDSLSMSAASCKETVGGVAETLSGQMTITITAGTLHPNAVTYPAHVAMKIDSTGFVLVQGARTTSTTGDMTIDLTETSSTAQSLLLSGNSLQTSVTTASGTRSFALKQYNESVSVNNGALSYTVSASIASSNTRLGSGVVSYTVSTPSPITITSAGDYTGGSLKVTGSGSALLITVTATNTFQIQVDTNGDGTYDTTTTSTSTELKSLL